MKTLPLAALALLGGATVALADTTRTSVDWAGRYVGTLPCASCPGIDTTLTINDAGFYTLREVYLEEKDATFTSEGEFAWNAAGNAIGFKDGDTVRTYLIGEGAAWVVGEDNKPVDDAELVKMMEFNGAGQQLYIDPRTIVQKPGKVAFSGLMNFENAAEAGQRSLTGEMVIDCAKGAVDMPKVSFFDDLDGTGRVIDTIAIAPGDWVEIPAEADDVLRQAKDALCS